MLFVRREKTSVRFDSHCLLFHFYRLILHIKKDPEPRSSNLKKAAEKILNLLSPKLTKRCLGYSITISVTTSAFERLKTIFFDFFCLPSDACNV